MAKTNKSTGGLSSPMQNSGDIGKKGSAGIYDHNPTPAFSKPHDMGKDTIPLKITDGNITGHPTKALATPMGTDIKGLGKKKR